MSFADDTALVIKSKDIDLAIQQTNFDLTNIFKWLNVNKLKLNIEKTKWILISKKDTKNINCEIKIDDQIIERVSQIKYLGILIDDKMTMHKQIEETIKMAASKVNFMSRTKKKLTFETKKLFTTQ